LFLKAASDSRFGVSCVSLASIRWRRYGSRISCKFLTYTDHTALFQDVTLLIVKMHRRRLQPNAISHSVNHRQHAVVLTGC